MNDIARAVEFLRKGRLVAFPTETVYGLGADATSPGAIERIYRTKGRPSTNPLIIHVAGIAAARRLVPHWPREAQVLAKKFWPGPLTLVLPKHPAREAEPELFDELTGPAHRSPGPQPAEQAPWAPGGARGRDGIWRIPDSATAGLQTVAIRVPAHPLALQLLEAFARPLAAPSANRSTRVSPTRSEHVRQEFPDSVAAGGLAGEPAMILDGGPCHVGIESTVLDLTHAPATILRPGRVTAQQLEALIGPVRRFAGSVSADHAASSPGQQNVHYAPHAPAYRFARERLAEVMRHIAQQPGMSVVVACIGRAPAELTRAALSRLVELPTDPQGMAANLYATLRLGDEPGVSMLFIESPPGDAEWTAIRDRLGRATKAIEESGPRARGSKDEV